MTPPTDDVRATLRGVRERDPLGKAALYSSTPKEKASFGTITVECSQCHKESPVGLRDIPGLLFPLPLTLPRKFHTLATCPSCSRRAWVRARVRL